MKYPPQTKISRKLDTGIPNITWTIVAYNKAPSRPRGDGTFAPTYVCQLDKQFMDSKISNYVPLILYEDYMENQFNIHVIHFNDDLFMLD